MYAVLGPMEPDGKWSDQYTASVNELNTVLTLRNERIDEPIDDHVVSMPAISSRAHIPITTSMPMG